MSRGDLKISYQTSKCLDNPTVSCIEAVMVDVRYNDSQSSSLSVVVDRRFHVIVNGRLVPGSADSTQFSLKLGQVVVKRASSLFMAVTGFGFRVLYDANGKIYVTMEPFYSRRVISAACSVNFADSRRVISSRITIKFLPRDALECKARSCDRMTSVRLSPSICLSVCDVGGS